ncbi:hypothetical protein D3C77_728360 [compost metagenome]
MGRFLHSALLFHIPVLLSLPSRSREYADYCLLCLLCLVLRFQGLEGILLDEPANCYLHCDDAVIRLRILLVISGFFHRKY